MVISGPGGTPVDVVIKVKVANLQDINNINKRVNAQVKQMEQQWAKVGRKINVARIDVKAMDASVNSLGNHMGFVAFQWMFISGIASRALQTMQQIGQQIVEKGAAGTTAMTRAMVQTGQLGESLDKVALREKGIQNFIISMAMETGKSLTETADAVKDVGKALNDVNGVIPVTKEVMRLAVIEELNMSEAAKGFIGVMNNYKNSVSDVRDVSNTLIGVNLQSRISLNELIHAFEFSAATASDMGMTLEETGAILGMMGDRLTPGRIGRQFATLLEELRETSVATNPVLHRLGVNIYDVEGNMKNLPQILKDVARAMKDAGSQSDAMKAALLDTMKLDRVAKRALIGLIDSMDEYDDTLEQLTSDEMNQKIQETYERLTDTPEANIEKLKGAVELLSMEFVGGLAPAMSQIVARVQEMLRIAEINDLIHTFGKELGDTVLPVINLVAAGMKEFAQFMLDLKKTLGPAAKLLVAFAGAMVGLLIVSHLIMMFAMLAAVIEKLGFTSITSMLKAQTLMRVIGKMALFAGLLIVAFLGVRYAVKELRKGFDEANWSIVALGLGAAGAAIGIAAFINPIMGIAIGLAVAIPLIFEATQTLLKLAGVKPGDEWGLVFLKVLDLVLDGINEWGEKAAQAIGNWFAEMNERGMKRFHENWGWLGQAFEGIADQINPSLEDFEHWGIEAMTKIWEGLKATFPILGDFEKWWNEKLDEWEKVLSAAGQELGERFGTEFIDGLLKALGPFGTLLKHAFNIDIGQMIHDATIGKDPNLDPTRFVPKDAEGNPIPYGAGGTGKPDSNWWRDQFERTGQNLPVEQRPKEWDELPQLTEKQFEKLWQNPHFTYFNTPPTWWDDKHPSWADDLVYGTIAHYQKIGHPSMPSGSGAGKIDTKVNTTYPPIQEPDKKEEPPITKGDMDNIFDNNKAAADQVSNAATQLEEAQARKDEQAAAPQVDPNQLAQEAEAARVKAEADANLATAEEELFELFLYGKVTLTQLNEAQYEVASTLLERKAIEGEYNSAILRAQQNAYLSSNRTLELYDSLGHTITVFKLANEHQALFAEVIAASAKATIATTKHTTILDKGINKEIITTAAATAADLANTASTKIGTETIDVNTKTTETNSDFAHLNTLATEFNTRITDLNTKVVEGAIRAGNEHNRRLHAYNDIQDVMTHEVGKQAVDHVHMQNSLIRGTNAMNALATAASRTVERLASFSMSVGYSVGTTWGGNRYISSVWPVYSMQGFGGMPAGVNTNTPSVTSERDPNLIGNIVEMLKGIWGEEGPGGKSVTVNMNIDRLDPETDIEELAELLAERVANKDSLE